MSQRDLRNVLTALWNLSSGDPGVGVPVVDVSEAIGRAHNDMRTPLNLRSLSDEGRVMQLTDDTWALTPQGIDWLKQDRDLSDR
jgi:hypothetical protein